MDRYKFVKKQIQVPFRKYVPLSPDVLQPLFMRVSDFSGEFEDPKTGVKGDVFWPMGSAHIVVSLTDKDNSKATYQLSLQDVIKQAIRWKTKKHRSKTT